MYTQLDRYVHWSNEMSTNRRENYYVEIINKNLRAIKEKYDKIGYFDCADAFDICLLDEDLVRDIVTDFLAYEIEDCPVDWKDYKTFCDLVDDGYTDVDEIFDYILMPIAVFKDKLKMARNLKQAYFEIIEDMESE